MLWYMFVEWCVFGVKVMNDDFIKFIFVLEFNVLFWLMMMVDMYVKGEF